MNLLELQEEARKVLGINPQEGFTFEEFSTGSGSLHNTAKIPEVHRDNTFRYDTVANGSAYATSVTIECRDTGAKDADGKTIYLTPCGKVFVWDYRSGNPYSFDRGYIEIPNLSNARQA